MPIQQLSFAGHAAGAERQRRRPHRPELRHLPRARFLRQLPRQRPGEQPTIQALDLDKRSLALPHVLKAPPSHGAADFETHHGAQAGRNGAACATCHTQESCLTCHRAEAPPAVLALYRAGPGRAAGAQTTARKPASHIASWKTQHGAVASATLGTCTSCHARVECLTCHQPDPSRRGSYHPASYLVRHPSEPTTRSSSCTDCHNTGEFCQTCHKQAGLTSRRALLGAGGYHDGNRQFFLGHGQAARQALESCVACHVERDCLTCHSVVKGRSFNMGFGAAYGYGYFRLAAFLFALWAGGALLYGGAASQGSFAPSNPSIYLNKELQEKCGANWTQCVGAPPELPGFNPFVYSLDIMLPGLDLGQKHDWQPIGRPGQGLQVGLPAFTSKPQGDPEYTLVPQFSIETQTLGEGALGGIVIAQTLLSWMALGLLLAILSGLIKKD